MESTFKDRERDEVPPVSGSSLWPLQGHAFPDDLLHQALTKFVGACSTTGGLVYMHAFCRRTVRELELLTFKSGEECYPATCPE